MDHEAVTFQRRTLLTKLCWEGDGTKRKWKFGLWSFASSPETMSLPRARWPFKIGEWKWM